MHSKDFTSLYDADARNDHLLARYERASEVLRSDRRLGLQELENLAHRGSLMSALAVADAAREGLGYDRDLPSAEAWYGAAARAGSSRALVGLAITYLFMGRRREAVRKLEEAVERNYPPAYDTLAAFYFRGYGVAVDKLQARDLWREAARLGHLPAKHNIVHYSIRGDYGPVGMLWGISKIIPVALEISAMRRDNPNTERLLNESCYPLLG